MRGTPPQPGQRRARKHGSYARNTCLNGYRRVQETSQTFVSESPKCVRCLLYWVHAVYSMFHLDVRSTFRLRSTALSYPHSAAWSAGSRIVVRLCSPFHSPILATHSARTTSLPARRRAAISRATMAFNMDCTFLYHRTLSPDHRGRCTRIRAPPASAQK